MNLTKWSKQTENKMRLNTLNNEEPMTDTQFFYANHALERMDFDSDTEYFEYLQFRKELAHKAAKAKRKAEIKELVITSLAVVVALVSFYIFMCLV